MKHLNAALIVGVTVVFLFLNIYGLIEILRFLRDKQLQRHKLYDSDELLEVDIAEPVEETTTRRPVVRTTTSTVARTTHRTRITTTPTEPTTTTTTTTLRTWPPTSTHRHHEYGLYGRPHPTKHAEHPHRHHHTATPHRRVFPYFISSTTTSTAPPRIHITTNKIPDPTTDRSRIEIHLPHSKETVRHELPRYGTTIHVPKFSTPAPPPPRPPFPPHRPTTTSTPPTTTSTTPPLEKDDVTIVTALMDIGRGEWDRYRRPLEQYHLFMENLLSLQNYMVIFTDKSSYSFIHKYRKNMGEIHRTKIHLITLKDLPLSRHLDAATKIIEEEHNNDKLWRSIWDPAMKDHPEARSAEYDVLVNSKTYFLYNATLEDPFSTEFFVWIDAGYGHGNQSVFPYNNKWKPQFPRNKISVIKLTPVHDSVAGYNIGSLYRRNWSVISGGFIAGDKRSIGQLHTLVHRKFIELTYHNKVDDDQTVLVLVINSYPQLFSITHGDWFDAFRLFSSDQSQYGR